MPWRVWSSQPCIPYEDLVRLGPSVNIPNRDVLVRINAEWDGERDKSSPVAWPAPSHYSWKGVKNCLERKGGEESKPFEPIGLGCRWCRLESIKQRSDEGITSRGIKSDQERFPALRIDRRAPKRRRRKEEERNPIKPVFGAPFPRGRKKRSRVVFVGRKATESGDRFGSWRGRDAVNEERSSPTLYSRLTVSVSVFVG